MASRSRLVWEDRAVINQLRTFNARADRAIKAVMTLHAARGVAYARSNAKWTDRTSNARNGLFGQTEFARPSYSIIFGHSVSYGIWLEVRFSGRYAIIRPTIDHEAPLVMKNIEGLYGRMFRS